MIKPFDPSLTGGDTATWGFKHLPSGGITIEAGTKKKHKFPDLCKLGPTIVAEHLRFTLW